MAVAAVHVAAVFMVAVAVSPACVDAARSRAAGEPDGAGTRLTGAAIEPVGRTAEVSHDPDDPAIWLHPTDLSQSLILGTDKHERTGGLYAFGLNGAVRQVIADLDRPNNVDVEYGVHIGGQTTDIVVLTERKQHRLRVFAISPTTGWLTDAAPGGLPVLAGERGEASEPMGIALYRRPRDQAVFAIVAPKTGDTENYLWQYALSADASGRLVGTLVRRFGHFSRTGGRFGEIGEIEAVVVDDTLGYVYYSDEAFGIRKYRADPDHPDTTRELAVIGTSGFVGDREGLAIVTTGDASGFLVVSDQVAGGTRLKLYAREGTAADPHAHPEVRTVLTVSDETDGLDGTARALPGFSDGLLVMMNARGRNFLLYDWRAIVGDRR